MSRSLAPGVALAACLFGCGSSTESAPNGNGGNGGSTATNDDGHHEAGAAATGMSGSGGGGASGGHGAPLIDTDAAGDTVSDAATGKSTSAGCAGLFCEDFETGRIDPDIWNVKTLGGQTVAVQSNVVGHGKFAAQFHANPNIVSYDFIITKNAPAGLRGHHFGRAYFQVTPKPPNEHTGFLFAGSSGFPTLKYLEVAGFHSGWQLTFVDLVPLNASSALSGPATREKYSSGGAAPVARWICLEWELNDSPDRITVFVDGKQDYSFADIMLGDAGAGLVGGFTDFAFGFYAWHPATYPFDVYYDDIVLDTKRVGCL